MHEENKAGRFLEGLETVHYTILDWDDPLNQQHVTGKLFATCYY